MLAAVSDLEASTLRKVRHHLIPFVAVLFFAAFINRANVGVAAAQMNRDLGFSAYVYGLGAGIFFIGYSLFEVPSNLILHKVGGTGVGYRDSYEGEFGAQRAYSIVPRLVLATIHKRGDRSA